MKAYRFKDPNDIFGYTIDCLIELADTKPRYENHGDPEEIPVPRGLESLVDLCDVKAEIERKGQYLGKVGCSRAYKFKGLYIALVWKNVYVLTLITKEAKRRFKKEFGDHELMKEHFPQYYTG